jgi:hypothetical protein
MENIKKPIYKKWWFWVIIIIVLIYITSSKENKTKSVSTAIIETKKVEVVKDNIKLDFAGSIDPMIATIGDKVVIKIDIQNLDTLKTLDATRILFSDTKFLNNGLIIVNVMSGGIQDGRSFKWINDGMKIPPLEKRSFQIVAQANKPGKYESIIQITPIEGGLPYEDSYGNSELVAKLTVLN